jgi:hypothetical protein
MRDDEPASAQTNDSPQQGPAPDELTREPAVTVPLVERDRWVTEPTYWDTQSFVAVSGRHIVPRPTPHAIKPPQRFQPVPRWKSYPALAVVCLAILLSCVGALTAMRAGASFLQPAATAVPFATHPAPTATHPAPTATHPAPTATAKPSHHKK